MLHVPIPLPEGDAPPIHKLADIPFSRNMQTSIDSFHPIWSNQKWTNLVETVVPRSERVKPAAEGAPKQETGLLQILDVKAARTFGNWISGLTDFERREEKDHADMLRQQDAASIGTSDGRGISPNEDPASEKSSSLQHSSQGSAAFGQAGKKHTLPKIVLPANGIIQKRRRNSLHDPLQGGPSRITVSSTNDAGDSLELTKGSLNKMDIDENELPEITKEELHHAFHEILGNDENDRISPSAQTPTAMLDGRKSDESILGALTTQSTIMIKLRHPREIWLEMMKTPLPQHPKSTTTSLLVVQVIPRSAQEVRMLSMVEKGSSVTKIEQKPTVSNGEPILSPSIDMNRVSISVPSGANYSSNAAYLGSSSATPHNQESLTGKPSEYQAWPFLDSRYIQADDRVDAMDSRGAETPVADRDDRMESATPHDDDQDEASARRKAVAEYFPQTEPMLVGNVDVGQLASFPRKTIDDPASAEALLLTTDWSKTPLGPMHKWPSSLKTAVSIVMAMPGQANLWWNGGNGKADDLTMIYNDHYAAMIQKKHPWMFGKTGPEGWAEVSSLSLRCSRCFMIDTSSIDLVHLGTSGRGDLIRNPNDKGRRRVPFRD